MNFDDWTVAAARAWLRERLDEGAKCPCCTQRAQRYHRKLNSTAVYGLVQMYRAHRRDWGHAPSTGIVARAGGELARCRFWGLIEESSERREDGGRAGWWRVTELGEAFVHNLVKLPSHVWIYDNRLMGMDANILINVVEALGDDFNYGELMEGL